MSWILSLHAQTDLEAIRAARAMIGSVVRRVGGTVDEAGDIETALGEVLTNAAVHAYPDAIGPVSIAMIFEGGTFVVTVQDRGTTRSTPTVPHHLPDGGKGLFLVSRLVDHVAVHQNAAEGYRGVSVTMIRRLNRG